MPFITKDRREAFPQDPQPGDLCYKYYKPLVDTWMASPRWTTVHNLFKQYFLSHVDDSDDEWAARTLAWQVFFQLHIMPYELEQRAKNGGI